MWPRLAFLWCCAWMERRGEGEKGSVAGGGGWGDWAAKEEEEGRKRGEIGIFMCTRLASVRTAWWACRLLSLAVVLIAVMGLSGGLDTSFHYYALQHLQWRGKKGMEEVKKPWSYTHTCTHAHKSETGKGEKQLWLQAIDFVSWHLLISHLVCFSAVVPSRYGYSSPP